MQIGGAVSTVSITRPSGKTPDGKRARIEKEIEKLEERKRKLLAKMKGGAGTGGDGAEPSGKPSRPADRAAAEYVPVTMPPADSATAPASLTPGDDAPRIAAKLSVKIAANALRLPSMPKSTPPPSEDDLITDPKLIMRLVQAIDLMIMALRQQLDDDEMLDSLVLESDDPESPLSAIMAGDGLTYQNGHGDTVTISAEAMLRVTG